MQPNGQIDGSDLQNLGLNPEEELECYVCGYCLDAGTLNVKRNVSPIKGVLRANTRYDVSFYPYGKKGGILKTGISYYGNGYGTELTANVDENEIYKVWSRLKQESLDTLERQEKRLDKKRILVLDTFKGV